MHDTDDARAVRYRDYARARLRVGDLDGETVVLEPRPVGECRGGFPVDVDVAHVLTAFDPGPERLDADENARRQRALVAELPDDVRRWDAVAGAADGSHEEASVLVVGLTDERAREIARRWGQDAIFRWTRDAWSILPCDGAEPMHLGWSVSSEA